MLQGTIKHVKLILMIIVVLFLIYSSMLKVVGYPGMEESFMVWGYDKTIMYIVAGVELILATLLFIPKTRILAAIGIVIFMSGALYTHVSHYEYDQLSSAIFVIFACSMIFVGEFLEKNYFSTPS